MLLEETPDHKVRFRIPKVEEKTSRYPDSLPSVSSSEYVSASTSNNPVVKRIRWTDDSGGALTDVHNYPLSPTEIQRKRDNTTAIRNSRTRSQRSLLKPIGQETLFLPPL